MIGDMRERVTLQSPLRTGDGAGGSVVTWTEAATVWAKVEMPAGGEAALAERLEAQARLRLTLRHRDDVTTEMRASWRGRAFNIRALRDKDGRRRFLIIDCEEERP